MISLMCGIKPNKMNLSAKQKQNSQTDNRHGCKDEEVKTDWKFEVNRCKRFIETIQQQGPNIKHTELQSIFSGKYNGKNTEKI